MAEPKELHRGDPCPNCRGELRPAYVPTEDEWKRSQLKDYPEPLPVGADTAHPDQRADLGELHVCDHCGYQTRFPVEDGDDKGEQAAGAGNGPSAARSRPTRR